MYIQDSRDVLDRSAADLLQIHSFEGTQLQTALVSPSTTLQHPVRSEIKRLETQGKHLCGPQCQQQHSQLH